MRFLAQISCSTASTELIDRKRFKRYFQLLQTMIDITDIHEGLINHYNWKYVSLVIQNENLYTVVSRIATLKKLAFHFFLSCNFLCAGYWFPQEISDRKENRIFRETLWKQHKHCRTSRANCTCMHGIMTHYSNSVSEFPFRFSFNDVSFFCCMQDPDARIFIVAGYERHTLAFLCEVGTCVWGYNVCVCVCVCVWRSSILKWGWGRGKVLSH